MSNIQKYEPLPLKSFADLKATGKEFARCDMLGVKNESEGLIVAMTCFQQRMTPIEFGETYHIIGGKPSMRTDAMLARFVDRGGDFKIITRTSNAAEITATSGTRSASFAFTWAEAKLEPFVYAKGVEYATNEDGERVYSGEYKDNWATPRKRGQMLWARVVSDAVRTIDPGANKGSYTPEEVMDFPENTKPREPRTITPAEAAQAAKEVNGSSEIVEADEVTKPDKQLSTYDACPIDKPGMYGVRWSEFNTPRLEKALTIATLSDDYKERINLVLESRKGGTE